MIDKSTTDALLCDAENGLRSVRAAAEQVAQLVVDGGCFCLISHNQLNFEGKDQKPPKLMAHQEPDWLRAVIEGLFLGGKGGGKWTWAFEVHLAAAGAGPAVHLFRRCRRSVRANSVPTLDSALSMLGMKVFQYKY
eukprot:SAG11_NODE_198_length_12679_cov_7.778537_6_plen_136_part_00